MKLLKSLNLSSRPLLASAIFSFVIALSFLFFMVFQPGDNKDLLAISGVKPEYASVSFGIKPLGENWDHRPIKVNKVHYPNSIFAHAPSDLAYRNTKNFKYFKSACAIDDSVGRNGSVRFIVLADGEVLFRSKIVHGGEAPIPLFLDIRGKKRIELIVEEGENLNYDHAVWLTPEFLFNNVKGEAVTPPPQEQKTRPNLFWDTGMRTFPNALGLKIWNGIAIIFYLFLIAYLLKNKRYLTLVSGISENIKSALKQPAFFILLVTFLISVWIISPLFHPGLPTAWDAGRHLLHCQIMKDLHLSNFRLDGINPYWYLGVQHLLFYSPFFYFLTDIFHFLTFQQLPLDICFKLFYALSFLAFPFALYWLLRQLEISAEASALAALCVPAFSAAHGLGIEGLFVTGLLNEQFALVIFCFALGSLLKAIRFGGKYIFICGILIGLLGLSHIITAVFFALLLLCVLISELLPHRHEPYRNNLLAAYRTLAPAVIGFLIASFSSLSSFQFNCLRGPETAFGRFTYINFLSSLVNGSYFATPLIHFIILIGLVISIFSRKRLFYVFALLLMVVPIISTSSLLDHFGANFFGLPWRLIFQYRVLPHVAIISIVFLGLGIQTILNFAARLSNTNVRSAPLKMFRPYCLPLFYSLIILFLFFNVFFKVQSLGQSIKNDSDFNNADHYSFYQAWDWLKHNTPQNIIVEYEHRGSQGNTGFIDIGVRTNLYADRYTLSGSYTESTKTHAYNFLGGINTIDTNEAYSLLKRYNVSYLFTWNEDTNQNLLKAPQFFSRVYKNFRISVWQVLGHDFRYLSNNEIKIGDFFFSPEEIRWVVDNPKPNNLITVALAYHPNWHLTINGDKGKIMETNDHIISFYLPAAGKAAVDLHFRMSYYEYFYYFLSFCTLAFAACAIVLFP
jgi:hypothetical protein